MNQLLPYEQELSLKWDDLALPDENLAWADMRRRLDDHDDDGLVPVWLRGCATWGIIAAVLIGMGWWLAREQNWFQRSASSQKEVTVVPKESGEREGSNKVQTGQEGERETERERERKREGAGSNGTSSVSDTGRSTKVDVPPPAFKKEGQDENKLSNNATTIIEKKTTANRSLKHNLPIATQNGGRNKKRLIQSNKNHKVEQAQTTANENIQNVTGNADQTQRSNTNDSIPAVLTTTKPVEDAQITKDNSKNDTVSHEAIVNVTKRTDSVVGKPADSTVNKPQKKPTKSSTPVSFSAGLAIQQQLPINGQKLTPYNKEGRKGSISDYIPSVFARMYKGKWFIQSEFRYAAPQYTKEFLYKQKIQTDTSNPTVSTITSTRLKKTFYHQLPVSFNWMVTKDWSIGAGFVWNKFVSAVSSKDIVRHNNQTGSDSFFVKGQVVTEKQADSNFVKSYFQALFETQWRWKRLSVGVRYQFGLQPYVKFRLPAGQEQKENNSSLNIFLRYELWKSGKK